MGVLGYSTTAGSNSTALAGIGSLAEGVMQIKQINDAIRQQLADIAQLYNDAVAGIYTTGTASLYLVTTASGHTAYGNSMGLRLRFHIDCAGGATLINVNGLGPQSLKVFATTGVRNPAVGEIKADMVYDCIFVAALNCVVVTGQTQAAIDLTALQPIDPDLTALSGLGGTGFATRTATDTWATRQIVSTDGTITVTNPAGIAGNVNLAVPFACRAWVNFNGTGTPTIRASGNITFITKNGVGDYTISFNSPMVDANYVLVGFNTTANDGTKGIIGLSGGYDSAATLKTVSQVRIRTGSSTTLTTADFDQINIAIFR